MSVSLLRRAAATLRDDAESIPVVAPDVALPLADLFAAMADFADVRTDLLLPEGPGTLVGVARAVLREER